MNRIPITEAAKLAGISREQARYWSRLLDLEMIKDGRVSYIPPGSENILIAMKKAVDSGLSPAAAAVEVKNIYPLPVVHEVHQDNQQNIDIVLAKMADLEKSIMFLAQTVERQNHVIADQAKQINVLSTRLLPPPQLKPLHVWQPAAKKPPKVSWLKRAWLELFDPVQLRAA